MSAATDAAVAAALADLQAKIAADRTADTAELQAAVAALAAAEAEAARVATAEAAEDAAHADQVQRLRAAIVALGGNPDGGPVPPPVPTLTATHAGAGNVDIAWSAGFVPVVIGRTGRDRTGWPPAPRTGWTTAEDNFGGVSPAIVTAGKFRFTAMDTGVEEEYWAADAANVRVAKRLKVAAPPTPEPPIPPPAGTFKVGVFRHDQVAHLQAFSTLIGHPVRTVGMFQYLPGGDHARWVPFLKADPRNAYDLCIQPVRGDGSFPGFGAATSTYVDPCRAVARQLQSLGIAGQTMVRLFGETNANWFPWGLNPEWYRLIAPLCIDAMKAEAPGLKVTLNVVPGKAGSPHGGSGQSGDPEAYWVDKFDGVSLDQYFWYIYGNTPEERARAFFSAERSCLWAANFVKAKGKFWVISETAVVAPSGGNGAYGDDPATLRLVLDALDLRRDALVGQRIAERPAHWLYENVGDGGVNTTLEQNPKCVAELRAFCDTLPVPA